MLRKSLGQLFRDRHSIVAHDLPLQLLGCAEQVKGSYTELVVDPAGLEPTTDAV